MTVRAHRPRRQVVLYLLIGGATFAIDFASFWILYQIWGSSVLVATTGGFWLSFVFNFLANKYLTFGATAGTGSQLIRYAVLVAANYVLNLAVIHLFLAAGGSAVVGKIVAVGVLTVVNFFVYRRWVFTG